MNDPVDRVISDRKRLDAGFPGGVLVSIVVHLLLVGAVFAAPILFPNKPVIQVADGFADPLPRGGGGTPEAAPPAAAPPPPLVLKPPTDVPKPTKDAIPDLDSRKTRKKPETPPPTRGPASAHDTKPAAVGTTAGTGASSSTPGVALGAPPGLGTPDGTDAGGDWYLASVQQKIWMLWNQQVKSDFTQPVAVTFTIQADGSVTDVETTQSSGASLLDMAAKRAIYSAGPFAPLPKSYGTNRKTIQATFKPTS